jgi:hypothetical protein
MVEGEERQQDQHHHDHEDGERRGEALGAARADAPGALARALELLALEGVSSGGAAPVALGL